ncbi:MAG: hypothetical protein KGZ64_00435 [Thermaerobacter sp.]|nr:hypothetical protein [Thermaerobacter sp.]
MLDRAKAWLALRTKTASDNTLPTGSSVLLAFLSSLLVCYWVVVHVGFLPTLIHPGLLFHPMHHLVFHLLFLIPASLAIALKKGIALLLGIPYLILLGFSLIQILLLGIAGDGLANWLTLAYLFFIAAVVVPTVLVAGLWNKDGEKKRKIYHTALMLQVALSVGLAYYYTYHYGVWHLSEQPVCVRRLRLGDGNLSHPLIEEDAAYIVDSRGRLYRVDLALGRKRLLAQIPWPTAAEVGLPELTRHPNVERPQNPRWGVLSRVDDDDLSFQYDFHLHRRTEHGYVHAGSWTMEITIHQEHGRVTWRLKEREKEAFIEFPVRSNSTAVQGKTIWITTDLFQYRPFTVIIAGDDIKTAIDPLNPLGMVTWEHANHGWILVGTDRGGLIIATIKER